MTAIVLGLFMIILYSHILPNVFGNFHLKHLYTEPFCGVRISCCTGRNDTCSLKISDTRCYCDDHCYRGSDSDCCPDYLSVCKPYSLKACKFKGRYYRENDIVNDNCNICKCRSNGLMACSSESCITDDNVINKQNSVNYLNSPWKAKRYDFHNGKTCSDGFKYRLGSNNPENTSKKISTKINSQCRKDQLPNYYNVFQTWKNLGSNIRDQGWCGSSWAFSTAQIVSDRFYIMSKQKRSIQLSPQQIISCVNRNGECRSASPTKAWQFLNRRGGINEKIHPYTGNKTICPKRRQHRSPNTMYNFYRTGPPYLVDANECAIMQEIIDSGPVQASFRVYCDFFSYSHGIYKCPDPKDCLSYKYHSVRLVGWGEKYTGNETIKYWIAANSWGCWWGEDGLFRILKGQNECSIEDYVIASIPNVHLHIKPSNFTRN